MNISKYEQDLFPDDDILDIVEGGMGSIYHLRLRNGAGRRVAKTIRKELAYLPEYRRRFLEEAQIFMSLPPHPLIARPIALVTDYAMPYISMAWIDGWTLAEWSTQGRMSKTPTLSKPVDWENWWPAFFESKLRSFHPAALLFYTYEICVGLEWLYLNGVEAHGDIHNKNIMILRDEPRAVLIDLGLARATELISSEILDILPIEAQKHVAGCMPYMAPELLRGESAPNQSTDVYALGVTMYVALTENFPYGRHAPLEDARTLQDILTKEFASTRTPTPAEVSKSYQECILKSIALQAGERYQNVSQLKEAIEAVLDQDYRLKVEIRDRAATPSELQDQQKFEINRAVALTDTPGGLAKALPILQDVLARDPNNVQALQVLAQILYDNGQELAANDMINRAVQLAPNEYYSLNTQGIILNALKRFDEAIAFLRRAVSAGSNDVQRRIALSNLSMALREKNLVTEADQALADALALGDDRYVLMEKARVECRARHWESAINTLKRVLELSPSYTEAWHLYGSALSDAGRSKEAYHAYRRGLAINPNDPDMLMGMAYAAAESGHSKGEIVALLDRAELLGRNDSTTNALRAATANKEEAVIYATKALKQDPTNELAKSILRELPNDEEDGERISTLEMPLSQLMARGFKEDEIISHAQAVARFAMTANNSGVPITKAMLDSLLTGLDHSLVIAVCNELIVAFETQPHRGLARIIQALRFLLGYLDHDKTEP